MRSYHFFGEKRLRLLYTLLLLVGTLLVLASLTVLRRAPQVPGYYAVAEGVVYDSGSARMARVRFPLQNGEDFEAVVPPRSVGESRFYQRGERLTVYYNPVDPEELIVVKRSFASSGTLLFFGIMAGGLGFRLLVGSVMRNLRVRVIRENGRRIRPQQAEIEYGSVRLLPFISRPAAYLQCRWEGAAPYGTLTFVSEAFPPQLAARLDPAQTVVFFLEHSPGVYFIPLPYPDTAVQTPQHSE
jgi:hypothetical protein